MSSAARLQPDNQSQKKDTPVWGTFLLAVILAAVSGVASYSWGTAVSQTKIDEQDRRVKALEDDHVRKDDINRIYDELHLLRKDVMDAVKGK